MRLTILLARAGLCCLALNVAPRHSARVVAPSLVARLASFKRFGCAALAAATCLTSAPGAAPAMTGPEGRALVSETWDLVDKYYYNADNLGTPDWLGAKAKFGAVAEAAPISAPGARLATLSQLHGDVYTRVLDSKTYADISRFDVLGVGLILAPGPDGVVRVVSPPLPGSSAAQSGQVATDDLVLKINGVSTTGQSSFDLLDLVDKASDTSTLSFTLQRGSGEPFALSLARRTAEARDPISKVLLNEGVGYLRLSEFNARSGTRAAEELRKLEQGGATRFVIDVRGNPGGAFQEAISLSSLFLPPETPVVTVFERGGADAAQTTFRTKQPQLAGLSTPPLALELWVDARSASSSEIFTGALRDNCAAVVASDSEHTFGKGLVQAVFGLKDNTGLVVTVAQYQTPKGTRINGIGIAPDVALPKSNNPFGGATPLPTKATLDAHFADLTRTCTPPRS